MHTTLSRLVSVAAVCGMLSPLSASAAALTATQQGAVSASAPQGAQRAVFLEASLYAECDKDVKVTSMTVRHRGLGEATDLVRVYATRDDVRLTHTRSLDSSDRTATLEFIPALVVKKCTTARIQVRGDFSAEASVAGEHGLLIESIVADAPVTLASAGASKITTRPLPVGTVTVSFLPAPRALLFGKNRTISRLRFEADHIANHRLGLITLTNKGKATDADLTNIRLETRTGEVVTNVASSLDGKTVTLTFDPLLVLNHNDSILLDLKADVNASKKQTIRFVLEAPSDLQAGSGAR